MSKPTRMEERLVSALRECVKFIDVKPYESDPMGKAMALKKAQSTLARFENGAPKWKGPEVGK